jgi:hypothetical protein
MDVTMCDRDDCEEFATFHIKVIDPGHKWHGHEFDLCELDHPHIARYMEELNAEYPDAEEETA